MSVEPHTHLQPDTELADRTAELQLPGAGGQAAEASAASCANCGAPLAGDQRYCLNCGERRVRARSAFLDGLSGREPTEDPSRSALAPVPRTSGSLSPALTWLAGVGVLLLAMGVGVLIGRAGGSKTVTVPPQVVSVDSAGSTPVAPGTTATTPALESGSAGSTTVSDEWPTGKNGYTMQLQTLGVAGTTASEVTAAKQAASAKGAKAVGVLRSDDYKGLPSGLYVIYSGVYSSAAQAKQALASVRAKFPAASVIHVAGATSAGGSSTTNNTGSSKGTGTSEAGSSGQGASKSSSPTSSGESGQSYEQKLAKEPDVVETG